MINVNFFEKKKTNILPYIIGGIFLLLLLFMGLYIFLTRMYLENSIEESNTWISENTEEVVLSRRISQVDQLTNQAITVQNTLKEIQYPMNTLTEDLTTAIPNETDRVASFQLTETNQVTLILENTEATMGQNIVEDIESRPYVTGVQFLSAQSESQEEDAFRFELIVDIDVTALAEEETE